MPLRGVTVIELGLNLAGPLATQILADLGADVIKVERPNGGDDTRGWGPPFVDGSGMGFHGVNRSKRAITLDLATPEGVARLLALVKTADVFLENLRPGTAEALGLGPEPLCALNPRLVYCSVSAFGHRGPLRRKPGYEILVQAFAGNMSLTGEEHGPPVRMGAPVNDYGTGMWTALGCLAALRQRDRTGHGAVVTTSLFETALFWLAGHVTRYQVSGEPPQRHATGSPRMVGFQAFDTKNGPVVVAAGNDRLFAKLARAIGHAEWAEDERFRTNASRLPHRQFLIDGMQAAFATETKEHWLDRLEEAGVPCAPLLTVPEVLEEPQTQALGMLGQAPETGVPLMGLPLSIDGHRPEVRRRPPRLGEHNAEIL